MKTKPAQNIPCTLCRTCQKVRSQIINRQSVKLRKEIADLIQLFHIFLRENMDSPEELNTERLVEYAQHLHDLRIKLLKTEEKLSSLLDD